MTDEQIAQDLHLVKIQKRDRKYKGRYQRARTVAWCSFGLLTVCAYLLGMSLYGGHVLQQRLQDKM